MALYDYASQQEGDLALRAGDRVAVIETVDSGWWKGYSNGREGWFPAAYVQVRSALAGTRSWSHCVTSVRRFTNLKVPEVWPVESVEVKSHCFIVYEDLIKTCRLCAVYSPHKAQGHYHVY